MEALEKQIRSDKAFMDEQAQEREAEREEFEEKLEKMREELRSHSKESPKVSACLCKCLLFVLLCEQIASVFKFCLQIIILFKWCVNLVLFPLHLSIAFVIISSAKSFFPNATFDFFSGRVRIEGQNQVFQQDKTGNNPFMRTCPV